MKMKNFTLIIAVMLFSIAIKAQTFDYDNTKSIKYVSNNAPKNIIKGASSCFELPSPVNQTMSDCNNIGASVDVNPLCNYAKLIITTGMDTVFVNDTSFLYTQAIDTAFDMHTYPGSDIVISEIALGSTDFVEIQNVSNSTIHTKDWFVVISANHTDINVCNSIVWTLPDTILPGETLFKDDNASSAQYWGNNIYFSQMAIHPAWVMIVDNCGNIVDALFHRWNNSAIDTMSVTINGYTLTPGTAWLGNGIYNSADVYSIDRIGNTDNQFASDFTAYGASGSETPGVQNTAITYPFTDITEVECPKINSNGHRGLMFNIVAKEDIQIESFSPYMTINSGDTVRVYYTNGSYLPEMDSLTNWNYLGYNRYGSNASSSVMTNIPLGNIFVAKGDTIGVYIVNENTSSSVRYSDGDTINSDNFIDVIYGHGIATVGGTSFPSRHFVGKIHYTIGRDLSNNTASISIQNKEAIQINNIFITDNNCTGYSLGSVDSVEIVKMARLNEGNFDHDYSASQTRGFMFEAPIDFNIDSLKVPEMLVAGEVQNIQIVKFTNGTNFTSLYYGNNLPADSWIAVNIAVNQGDSIAIIGARGTTTMHNAYGPTSYMSSIAGISVEIQRAYYQANLNTTQATSGDINMNTTERIAQIDMIYSYKADTNITYAWNTGATTMLIDSLPSSAYNLLVTNTNGCTDSISTSVVDLHPNPIVNLGVDSTLCGNDYLVLNAGNSFVSYTWSTGDTLNYLSVDSNGIGFGVFPYSVQVVDANGCIGSDTVIITFENCQSIDDYNTDLVNLYPNPNNGNFSIDLSSLNGKTNISIYNISGQMIKEIISENSATTIDVSLSKFNTGIYFISISNNNYKNTVKMIVR